ncbi:MAG: cytochrome P450 [Benjaminiella poitrasii]|nr:MAG: cytochrome P450 [Benjaminiella poitrasii]
MMTFIQLTAAVGALLTASIFYYENKNKNDSLPPKAPGYLPVVGHLLEMVKPIPTHQLFVKWSQEVGSIFTCYFGSQRWIVLNSMETIKDLIVDRGVTYSSRKLPDTLVHDLMGGDEGGGFAFLPYGPTWRHLRRIAHIGLIKPKIDEYQSILDERIHTFLTYLLELSKDSNNDKGVQLSHLIEHYTMTSILAIVFGDMCSFEPGDPVLHEAFALTDRSANSMSPSEQLREFFPVLKTIWPVKRAKYAELRNDIDAFYGKLLKQFKEQGCEQNCYMRDVLALGELTEQQITNFITIFIGAGSDTTASTLEWMIAYLANHPEIQDKAFEEIKSQVGLDRLPNSFDETTLPYVQAIITETLRLRPPAPFAIPHSTSKDDVYKGWIIPKDTTVVLNILAVNLNPERFPNPTAFQPERHLNQDQTHKKSTQAVDSRAHLSFSTGRRVCVGIHLAERTLFMAASMLLASFKVESVNGKINVDAPKDIHATTWSPQHYRVRLIPRHEQVYTF